MHLTISRFLGLGIITAMLGLVACAPQPKPEPFPSKTTENIQVEGDKAASEDTQATATEGDKTASEDTQATATEGDKVASKDTKATATEGDKATVTKGDKATSEEGPYAGTSATLNFTITDKGLETAKTNVDMARNMKFSVKNSTKNAYTFRLEGKKAKIESIAAGATGTCQDTIQGPGPLAVSVQRISTEKGKDFSPSTIVLNIVNKSNDNNNDAYKPYAKIINKDEAPKVDKTKADKADNKKNIDKAKVNKLDKKVDKKGK